MVMNRKFWTYRWWDVKEFFILKKYRINRWIFKWICDEKGEEYVELVSKPGKFEGEAPYVPYYWHTYMEGWYDRDDGDRLGFKVSAADRRTFPELRNRRWVWLRETGLGLVVEV